MEPTMEGASGLDVFNGRSIFFSRIALQNRQARWRRRDPIKLLRDPRDIGYNARIQVVLPALDGYGEQKLAEFNDVALARHLDLAGKVNARILSRCSLWARLTRWSKRLRRLPVKITIEVIKGEADWKRVAPIIARSHEIGDRIEFARRLQKTDPEAAIALYRDAISDILDLHFDNPLATLWRRVSYPIDALSALLEQQGYLQAAYDAIRDYENLRDDLGLPKTDRQNMRARKFRLEKQFIFAGTREGVKGSAETGRINPPVASGAPAATGTSLQVVASNTSSRQKPVAQPSTRSLSSPQSRRLHQ